MKVQRSWHIRCLRCHRAQERVSYERDELDMGGPDQETVRHQMLGHGWMHVQWTIRNPREPRDKKAWGWACPRCSHALQSELMSDWDAFESEWAQRESGGAPEIRRHW